MEVGSCSWIQRGRCEEVSGGPAGVCKSQIANDLVSHGLCLKDTGEPWRVLSKGRVVSSSCLAAMWRIWDWDREAKGRADEGSWWPWG